MAFKSKYGFILSLITVLLLSAFSVSPLHSQQQEIRQWLVLGPAPVSPAEAKLLKSEDKILGFNHISIKRLQPVNGVVSRWTGGKTLTWQPQTVSSFNTPETQVYYLAVYIEPQRWLQTDLVIPDQKSELYIAAFLDGKSIDIKDAEGKKSAELALTQEKHLLVLKILVPEGKKVPFKAYLENKEAFKNERLAIGVTRSSYIKTRHVLNTVSVGRGGILVSPNGRLAAVPLGQLPEGKEKRESWMEIIDAVNGNVVFNSRQIGRISNFQWLKNSTSFTYTREKDSKTSIYKYDLNTHRRSLILVDVENLGSYWWVNDNSFIIYSVYEEVKHDKGYKYVRNLPQRRTSGEYLYSMYIHYPGADGSGVTHRLTEKKMNFSGAVISPDGSKVIFTRIVNNYKKRPYENFSAYLFDLSNFSIKELFDDEYIASVTWSPDSRQLLVMGGPSAFGGIGNALKEGVIPNDYDFQAFIYNLNTGKATPISKKFDPTINEAFWHSPNTIYFAAEDKSFWRIYRYSVTKKTYRALNSLVDVVRSCGFAKQRGTAVYWGSSVNTPHKLYRMNLNSGKASVLRDYNREMFQGISYGQYENWNYTTKEGKVIMGRIYYPVNFNKTKKYPCITYYYGGTSPVTRNFAGRYPMEWYAAHGYAVYVLQPTGATGFGQESSAVHVNDWGKVTSDEIIGAVKELVKTHPFIDGKRIGAMGASYGGFLTQYLATRDEAFAAYISHAGITSLSSYWGVGDWGYSYSGFATAGSFPWNRKDIYVGHSPLFMAERIDKPLLLLHGDTDNNVPPGESYQMFAALKILGKDAALVTYDGQQHFIMGYKKRLHWMRTIMAWWDKHLKNQPEQWDYMFKK